jgi:hypothetical protein
MTTAEKLKKQMLTKTLVNEDFASNGGRIVKSSEWFRGFTPVNWKVWRFSDKSSLLVSTKGAQII